MSGAAMRMKGVGTNFDEDVQTCHVDGELYQGAYILWVHCIDYSDKKKNMRAR